MPPLLRPAPKYSGQQAAPRSFWESESDRYWEKCRRKRSVGKVIAAITTVLAVAILPVVVVGMRRQSESARWETNWNSSYVAGVAWSLNNHTACRLVVEEEERGFSRVLRATSYDTECYYHLTPKIKYTHELYHCVTASCHTQYKWIAMRNTGRGVL